MGDRQINVLVFGLGAIGGFYAFIISRNKTVSLSVVARSNFESIKANGLRIESANHGDHVVQIDHVYRQPSDADIKFDYIVCCNKAINVDSIPPLFEDVTDERTTFVIIQNGVGNEDPFRRAYPEASIISCVTWVGAIQKTPGIITHIPNEDMQMGLFRNPDLDPRLEQASLNVFADLMRGGGTVFNIEDNIQIKRWEKCVWNACWNPITTLTMVDTHTWLKSSTESTPMTKRLMIEMIEVARNCGVPLEYDLADSLIDKMLAMQGVFSSMHADMKEGRPLEVEVILGTAFKKAKEFGLDVPVLSTIYSLIVAVDQRLRHDQH